MYKATHSHSLECSKQIGLLRRSVCSSTSPPYFRCIDSRVLEQLRLIKHAWLCDKLVVIIMFPCLQTHNLYILIRSEQTSSVYWVYCTVICPIVTFIQSEDAVFVATPAGAVKLNQGLVNRWLWCN
jgi:hypothetical protein